MKKLLELVKNRTLQVTILVTVLAVIGGTGAYFLSSRLDSKPKSSVAGIEISSTPTPQTPTPTPSPTPTPTPTKTSSTLGVSKAAAPTSTPTQASQPVVDTKIDSATQIELCKTKAETHKTQTMTALIADYTEKNFPIVELADARTIGEIQQVALKNGYIKESDIVDAVAFYNKLRNDGFTVAQAEGMAQNAMNTWANYLRSLQGWAIKEVADYNAIVNGKGNLAYNDYYAKCLKNEN